MVRRSPCKRNKWPSNRAIAQSVAIALYHRVIRVLYAMRNTQIAKYNVHLVCRRFRMELYSPYCSMTHYYCVPLKFKCGILHFFLRFRTQCVFVIFVRSLKGTVVNEGVPAHLVHTLRLVSWRPHRVGAGHPRTSWWGASRSGVSAAATVTR